MADRLHLQPKHRRVLESLLRKHLPEVEVWAYGSRVTGRSHEGSDLDLVMRGPRLEKIPIGQLADFEEAVRESNIPFLVEARDWARLPERFHREIGRCHVLLLSPDQSKGEIGEWSERKWRDIATLEYGKGLRGEMRPGLIPVFGTNGQIGWHDTPLCQHPGVVVGRKGAYRGIHYSPVPFHVIDTAFYLRPTVDLDARWAFFNLLTQDINGMDSGSAIPSTSREEFYSLPVSVPPLDEQRAIAHVLGTLDDKIELNRRMNETLEATARALFKSWFVDFEPVRAKMEGWDTGLPKDVADRFPDRLDERGLPNGWSRPELGQLVTVLETGKRPRGGVANIREGIPSVGAESIVKVGHFDFSKTKYVPRRFYDSMSKGHVLDGDVLIYKDGGRPGVLRPAVTYASKGFPFSRFCINEHVFRVRTDAVSQQMLYMLLSTDDAFWQMRELATGVAQPGLNQAAMRSLQVTLPNDQVLMKHAGAIIDPLLDRCNRNSLDGHTYARIRDQLLPRLISGEIRIADAEKAVESVI